MAKSKANSKAGRTTNERTVQPDDPALAVTVAGLHLRNPTMLASGILGISQDIFARLYRAGAGAIVSKSISIEPIEGYRNPTIVSLGRDSYLNAVGLANPGAEAFSKEIAPSRGIPIIVSLVGSSDKEFPPMVQKFDTLGDVIGYEVNLSCPHVAKMGMEVGDDPEMVSRIVKAIKAGTRKPVIIKVGIGAADVVKIAKVAKESGADAITAINTIRAMTINVETGMPVLSNRIGGLSGAAIKPAAVRCVYEISKTGIPVIGCGGITTWEDAVEFILAGASAVQIGSAIGNRWIDVFAEIGAGIKKYLERKGMKNVMEISGLAHKY
jgi:dihydroorotate dehydrogenase (NAD+) catalytic subunit